MIESMKIIRISSRLKDSTSERKMRVLLNSPEVPYHTYELEFIKKFLITIKPQMRIIKLRSPKRSIQFVNTSIIRQFL